MWPIFGCLHVWVEGGGCVIEEVGWESVSGAPGTKRMTGPLIDLLPIYEAVGKDGTGNSPA